MSDVTRRGIRGERPGRQASGGTGTRTRRRGGGGEQAMVPAPEFTSYYGKPVLNPPTWQARDIAGYFFLGGLAGAGSVLAAAELTGRERTARALKASSAVAVTGSVAALIHDLGRPERFVNMLRVFKPTSPMNLGSWLLAAYGPMAGAAAALEAAGRLPRTGRAATTTAASLGPLVSTYTAVLAADTAVPAWHDGYRELPFVFAGSAATAASGMALLAAPTAENSLARSAALFGVTLEAAATRAMRRRLGMVAEAYEVGTAGRLMRAAEALSFAGAAGAALFGRRGRAASAVCGACLLAASACTRFGIFHAGMESARDPKYTVVPQRERRKERRRRAGGDEQPRDRRKEGK
ncbi:polysulfide reductase NrfD [Streptomyces sp. RB6PN25]|uniref:Polysulfide reductase NrfD n=1 Tax=Streptomyces humicola TaxID=2953240 RepID=A0ABT1Q190_9ACTN|nr:NrfD/PsrC family molybdoenzyme membrane anchor subunit [Streptomyces humicola]MCQ4083664.1 polysulfide reductase NrfD [Streptomyces humicola]